MRGTSIPELCIERLLRAESACLTLIGLVPVRGCGVPDSAAFAADGSTSIFKPDLKAGNYLGVCPQYHFCA